MKNRQSDIYSILRCAEDTFRRFRECSDIEHCVDLELHGPAALSRGGQLIPGIGRIHSCSLRGQS